MTRPTVRIGGQDQTGRISPKEPTFADALAYWKCDDSPFADSTANGLDFAGKVGRAMPHPIFPDRILRGYEVASTSVTDALLRLVGDMTIHLFAFAGIPAGRFDLQCRSTGDSDCLWGIGWSSGVIRVWDKSLSGGVQVFQRGGEDLWLTLSDLVELFVVRSGTSWLLYGQGKLLSTISGASENTPVGDEQVVLNAANAYQYFSHIAVWDSALSAARIAAEYKSAFGR